MKSDTRANLIFLIVLAVLMSPGAIIVTRKVLFGPPRKLTPLEPPTVRTHAPYMNPILGASALKPITTPRIGDFVFTLAQRLEKMQPGLKSILPSPQFDARMSKSYSLQLLATGTHENQTYVALLGWDGSFAPLPSLYKFNATTTGGQSVAGTLSYYEQKTMEFELREELREYGWVVPTDSTVWLIVHFPTLDPIDKIDLDYTLDQKHIVDQIALGQQAVGGPATLPAIQP